MPKSKQVTVGVEVTPKKAFASALEWPGWSRAGKTPEDAVAALAAYADRYAAVAKRAKLDFPFDVGGRRSTSSRRPRGTPRPRSASRVRFKADGRRTTAKDGDQLAAIVEAAWTIFDRVVAGAPAELRKGPRGGGRDRDKIVEHVVGADGGYARVLGLNGNEVDPRDRAAVDRSPEAHARGDPRDRRTAHRSPERSGRRATPRAGSRGTRSITPGRSRTAATRKGRQAG